MRQHTNLLLAVVALCGLVTCTDEAADEPAGDTGAAGDGHVDPSACRDADLVYGPVRVGATPQTIPADCPSTPTPLSTMVEAQMRSRQESADARRAELLDPGALTVVTCGTGTPLPSARAQSCTAVFANGQFLLFDAGNGAAQSLEDLLLPVSDLRALFITHYHSDHVADVGEVASRSWLLGRQGRLPAYGGEGIERLVDGFNLVYSLDDRYREAHHGDTFLTPGTGGMDAKRVDATSEGVLIYDVDGVTVTAFKVDHSPIEPAHGYRVSFGGRSVAISGDTLDSPGLVALSTGADILVSEVLDPTAIEGFECASRRLGDARAEEVFADIRTYHLHTAKLAALAEAAGVGTLVLTHQIPTLEPAQAELVFRGTIEAAYSGELVIAVDGTEITVPVP